MASRRSGDSGPWPLVAVAAGLGLIVGIGLGSTPLFMGCAVALLALLAADARRRGPARRVRRRSERRAVNPGKRA